MTEMIKAERYDHVMMIKVSQRQHDWLKEQSAKRGIAMARIIKELIDREMKQ